MSVEFNPILLLLTALLLALLSFAFVRRVGVKGWLVLGVAALICSVTNPDKDLHMKFLRQQARDASATGAAELVTRVRSGPFEPLFDYRDLGIASVVVDHGQIMSVGVLGWVWVVRRRRLPDRPGRQSASVSGQIIRGVDP